MRKVDTRYAALHTAYHHRGGLVVRVTGMAGDSKRSVLSRGRGKPIAPAFIGEPPVRPLVVDVRRVDECDEHVDVEQVATHASSSCRALTSSSVACPASGRTGSKVMPLRWSPAAGGTARARRASENRAAPSVCPVVSASWRAAKRTSSSIDTVVLMHRASSITHRPATSWSVVDPFHVPAAVRASEQERLFPIATEQHLSADRAAGLIRRPPAFVHRPRPRPRQHRTQATALT